MIVYDVNRDGKADVIASSAHHYGIWWFEQATRRMARRSSPSMTCSRARLGDARPDLRGHQRRRPQGPRHRQAFLVARPERGRLRQARPALLVRGQRDPTAGSPSCPARSTTIAASAPSSWSPTSTATACRMSSGQQEGRVPDRTGRSSEVRRIEPRIARITRMGEADRSLATNRFAGILSSSRIFESA